MLTQKYKTPSFDIWKDLYFFTDKERQAMKSCGEYYLLSTQTEPVMSQWTPDGNLTPLYSEEQIDEAMHILNEYEQTMIYSYDLNKELDHPLYLYTMCIKDGLEVPCYAQKFADNLNACVRIEPDAKKIHNRFYVQDDEAVLETTYDWDRFPNKYLIRMVKPNLTQFDLMEFDDLIWWNMPAESIKHTVPIGDIIREIYEVW